MGDVETVVLHIKTLIIEADGRAGHRNIGNFHECSNTKIALSFLPRSKHRAEYGN